MAITILVTDRYCNPVGDPIICWSSVDCTLRFNEVGSGHFVAPAYPWIREQLDASHRVVVIRDRKVFMAGPIERYLIEQSDDEENSGVGNVTCTFADDLSLIMARQVYPNPKVIPSQQNIDEWVYSGNAERALHALVNDQAGPGALPARRVPQLVMGGLVGVGGNVDFKTRLEPFGDVMRKIASTGGGLGFRTRQVGRQILFEVYQPEDKPGVRFGFGLGNLRYLAYERVAPTFTAALVGGQGDGADRYLLERVNTAQEAVWGRRETLVSRPGNDPILDLEEAGDEELAGTGETIRLQSSSWDTDDQRYGVHYDLGTRVSIAVDRDTEVFDLVRLVHLQAWATAGELISAMVGTQDASSDPLWVQRMRALERRVARVERTGMPA